MPRSSLYAIAMFGLVAGAGVLGGPETRASSSTEPNLSHIWSPWPANDLLKTVIQGDAEALPSWPGLLSAPRHDSGQHGINRRGPDQGAASSQQGAPQKTIAPLRESISKPLIWQEISLDPRQTNQRLGLGVLHPGAKPEMVKDRSQALEFKLYIPQ